MFLCSEAIEEISLHPHMAEPQALHEAGVHGERDERPPPQRWHLEHLCDDDAHDDFEKRTCGSPAEEAEAALMSS